MSHCHISQRVVYRYLQAGFSFQPDDVLKPADRYQLLNETQQIIEDFAKDKDFLESVLDAARSNDNGALKTIDSEKFSRIGSAFWQSRNWFFELAQRIPYLVLDVIKLEGTSPKLEKAFAFYQKPFRWAPKLNTYKEVPEKYLATLKLISSHLKLLQEAFAKVETKGLTPIKVDRFELFGGDSPKAVEVLKKCSKGLTSVGLGAYCTGKVTLVPASKLQRGAAAFYVKATDEIYLSPEVRGNQDVRVLCHEIAHRVYTDKSLKHSGQRLYDAVSDKGSWVSSYARTSPEENFCEMLSFAAIGELDAEDRALLKAALPSLKI